MIIRSCPVPFYKIAVLIGTRQDPQPPIAQRYRSQEQNKLDALQRLVRFIKKVNTPLSIRKKTKPSKQSIKKRVDSKVRRGKLKKLRQFKSH